MRSYIEGNATVTVRIVPISAILSVRSSTTGYPNNAFKPDYLHSLELVKGKARPDKAVKLNEPNHEGVNSDSFKASAKPKRFLRKCLVWLNGRGERDKHQPIRGIS
jgi:hypothetical protein